MKKILTLAILVFTLVAAAEFGVPIVPRKVQLDNTRQLILSKGGVPTCEIISGANVSPTARFAAGELQRFLSESLGGEVAILEKPSGSKIPICVGSGYDAGSLPRDGFVIKSDGKSIVICGMDDAAVSPTDERRPWGDNYERATLFGVYDFLERFIGARFVFPGEGGTVMPKRPDLKIPVMDILERPDNTARLISWYDGKWFDENNIAVNQRLNNYRLKMQTSYIPNNHGLGRMAYIERFGKSHPEYFALRENGTRSNNLAEHLGGQLCFSSGIREEIYQDAKAWLTGQSAESRGMWHDRFQDYAWDYSAVQPGFFNIMPQDGQIPCQCDACKKKAADNPNWISDEVWLLTKEVAERLKQEGIDGYLTQMAYGLVQIPSLELPDNVLVMVAENGPWSARHPNGWQDELKRIHSWHEKLRTKVWIWTYVIKYGGAKILDVPCSTPVAVGKFYSQAQADIFGSFMESSSDYAAFQFFNWYVFSKKMWDKETDTDKLLTETYQALYGPAAPAMTQFLERIEELWLSKIVGNVAMTASGPSTIPPSDHDLWNDIYSENEMKQLDQWLQAAETLVANMPEYQKRVKFIRENYYGILNQGRNAFSENRKLVASHKREVVKVADGVIHIDGKISEAEWQQAPVLYLSGMDGAKTEVETKVRLLRDSSKLYISYECMEPEMSLGYVKKLNFDDPDMWQNDSIEIFLDPSGKRTNYFQWIISRNGDFADMKSVSVNGVQDIDLSWNSGAIVKTNLGTQSWSMEIAIPLEALGEIDEENLAANFSRSRVLTKQGHTVYYSWSPFIRRFNDIANFGSLSFKPQTDRNLVQGGNFNITQEGRFFGGVWGTSPEFVLPQNDYIALDKEYFLFDGQSLRIRNPIAANINISQDIKGITGGKKYRVVFSVKVNMEEPPEMYTGVFIQINDGANFSVPAEGIRKSIPWTTYSYTFTARPDAGINHSCYIRAYVYNCKATAWFDGISIEEVD